VVVAIAHRDDPPARPELLEDPRDSRREFCDRHGWVGKVAFKRDRHDLCEPLEEGGTMQVQSSLTPLVPDLPPGKKRRLSVRERGVPRKKTVAIRHISHQELAVAEAELEVLGIDIDHPRPKVRGHCEKCVVCQLVRDGKSTGRDEIAFKMANTPRNLARNELACGHTREEVVYRSRPCVMVSCKHSLYLDVNPRTGSVTFNFPHLEPGELAVDRSCALDLAVRGGMTLDETGECTSLTRERIRQLEVRALVKLLPIVRDHDIELSDAITRHLSGPSASLQEEGVDGAVPSDVASLLDV
jgi:hypothetical protein